MMVIERGGCPEVLMRLNGAVIPMYRLEAHTLAYFEQLA